MNAAKQLALAAEALYACGFRGRANKLRRVADELALTEAAFDGIHAQLAAAAAERDALAAKVERLEGELVDAGYRQAEDRAELDALRATVERVRALPDGPPSGGYYIVSMRDVRAALDGEARP